ncbi:hypothetical protein TUM4438_05460 [Shewanella sairae]|uniref:Transcriptional regulator n=1 Tax=Shewanella sairae TaxID=190310 RepID=A0ABQ4P1K2_9GAMM|nr:hypothetical protein [Shewanella sairae]MCL1129698.1 hypothetical protein [Shewanella sairae]GIU41392.1 hypothetical protein TUM4438_05460 [Shewanella sairae]
MSNIIQLLERMGQDASLQTAEQYNSAINAAELSSELKQSLLTKNIPSLEKQLDICPDIYCVFLPAEDEDSTEESDEQNDSEPTSPEITSTLYKCA